MSQQPLNRLLLAAAARGILQGDATPGPSPQPWPIVLMTALGAWLAVIPFVAALVLLFSHQLEQGVPVYVLGVLILGVTLLVLRVGNSVIFVEQLGFPALLVGSILLAIGLYRDLPNTVASAAMALVLIGAAWTVPQTSLRSLLGALTCAAFVATMSMERSFDLSELPAGLYAALATWLVIIIWLDNKSISGDNASSAIALEAVVSGWTLTLLLGLAYSSGETFMLGALLEYMHGGMLKYASDPLQRILSVSLAAAGATWLTRQWPICLTRHILLAAALLVSLCWLMPLLGGALLILAICVTSERPLLAAAAAVSAAWIVGSFYYQLNLELATKALILAAIGAAFGVIGWLQWQRKPNSQTPTSTPIPMLMALSLLAILAVVNVGIWQKEKLIRAGRPVFIELAPVDPRSLMQGDYMRLNFRLPDLDVASRHVKIVAIIDSTGIAILRGVATVGMPLAKDEILIELVNTGSGLRPASDAWYFKEGEEKRWERAKYGEFRVDESGRALLVNLRGANLETL